MAEVKSRYWGMTVFLLIAVIIVSSLVALTRYKPAQPIVISSPSPQPPQGAVFITGAVNSPGLYPLKTGDNIESLIRSAGGTSEDADLTNLRFFVPSTSNQPQKIDINRAEVWLLEALPGIGETKAQAIIQYRQKNGPFRNTWEITMVEGIGTSTLEGIKDFITIAGY